MKNQKPKTPKNQRNLKEIILNMNYETIRVRMPNGSIRKAQIKSNKTVNGYRTVQVGLNKNVKVSGRVSARHGFKDNRVHNIEIRVRDIGKIMSDDDFVLPLI